MFEYFIGGKKLVVVGDGLRPEIDGTLARERLRGRLKLMTGDSTEIAEVAHMATAYIGNETLPLDLLLERTRERFRIASQKFPKGDSLKV